jgi:hypothetical protein
MYALRKLSCLDLNTAVDNEWLLKYCNTRDKDNHPEHYHTVYTMVLRDHLLKGGGLLYTSMCWFE